MQGYRKNSDGGTGGSCEDYVKIDDEEGAEIGGGMVSPPLVDPTGIKSVAPALRPIFNEHQKAIHKANLSSTLSKTNIVIHYK